MLAVESLRSWWMMCLLAASAAPLLGCAGDSFPADTARVEGTVTYQGSPVAGATVTFRSDTGSAGAGKTNAEGVYRITSAAIQGGIPAGTYQITVKKFEVAESGVTEEDPNYEQQAHRPAPPPKSLLPEKYARLQTSGLQATVEAGENQVPLELTD